jgi:hypothetical protein
MIAKLLFSEVFHCNVRGMGPSQGTPSSLRIIQSTTMDTKKKRETVGLTPKCPWHIHSQSRTPYDQLSAPRRYANRMEWISRPF